MVKGLPGIGAELTFKEVFEYPLTKLDPVSGDHIDPPSVAIYETLLNKDSNGEPKPGLAESWETSPDGLVWRLRLRADARFHTGGTCDANAVVRALDMCRWGDGLKRQVWYWDPVDSCRPVSPEVVEFRLHYPCVRLPSLLWGTHTAIANPETRTRLGADFGVSLADGTGEYRMLSFSESEVVVERVDSRWPPDRRNPPSSIKWISEPNPLRRREHLTTSSADVVRAIQFDDVAESGGLWRLDSHHENSQIYLALNFEDPRGFAARSFRQAIESFIDRSELVAVALGGEGDGRRSPIPVADQFAASYDASGTVSMPIEKARATLASLGYSLTEAGILERDGIALRVDCVVQDTEVIVRVAEVVRAQLRRAGLDLNLSFVKPFADFYRAVEAGPAAFISKWLWPDAMEAVMGFSRTDCAGDGGGNWQNADTSRVDESFDRFLKAGSEPELQSASANVQGVFMDELPYLPLCSTVETMAISSRVRNFGLVPRTLYPSYAQVEMTVGAP